MFKTPEGQAKYFAAYEENLALWSVPVESFDTPTRYGPTHVHVCGPEDGPPLVLIHGGAVSSTMWYPNVKALSEAYRVYVPDVIGEVGKSVRTRPVKGAQDYVAWLTDVLDNPGLQQAHVAGLSLGGFIALSFASAAPERVMKLILMSPVGLLRMRTRFYARLAAAVLLPMFSSRYDPQTILGMTSPLVNPVIKQVMAGASDFDYKMIYPTVLSDKAMHQISAPTLLLLGEGEIIYDPGKAANRAKNLLPRVETVILREAGHALNFDQPELVHQHVLAFLEKDVSS